jgi:hypothetical protein
LGRAGFDADMEAFRVWPVYDTKNLAVCLSDLITTAGHHIREIDLSN